MNRFHPFTIDELVAIRNAIWTGQTISLVGNDIARRLDEEAGLALTEKLMETGTRTVQAKIKDREQKEECERIERECGPGVVDAQELNNALLRERRKIRGEL